LNRLYLLVIVETSKRKGMNDMKSALEIFSENLRNQLFAKRKTQAQLSKHLDVTGATVSRWVNGISMPRPDMLDRICTFLMCSAEDLMADHTKVIELAPEDVLAEEMNERPRLFRLMFIASKMSDENLDALIQIAEKMK
jgi:transcriptional regulator with XRE-family HTH domain